MTQIRRMTTLAMLVGSLALTVPAQKAKPDKWVKETLKKYSKAIGERKGAKDAEAIELIDEMLKKYETMHPKDKKDFAKGIAQSLLSPRVKREPTQDGIFRTTIKALSLTGTEGSKYLWKAFEYKKFKGKEWINLRGDMLEHLGRTKDEKYVDSLLDVALKDPNDTLMAKGGGALKYFKDMKQKPDRQEVAKKLIKKFANIYDNAHKNLDPGDLQRQTWMNRLVAVSDPWNTTLQALTRQHYRKPGDWNTFWNKNKGKDWDKPAASGRR